MKKALRETQTLRACLCRRGPSSISVPTLKQIALFVQKLLGVKNFEIGSRDPGHANLGVVLYSIRRRSLSSVSVPNLKRIALFVRKLLGVPCFAPQDGQNLISWRWSLPLPTNPVWWGSMHAISSCRGNRLPQTQTDQQTQTNPQTGPITMHCAA